MKNREDIDVIKIESNGVNPIHEIFSSKTMLVIFLDCALHHIDYNARVKLIVNSPPRGFRINFSLFKDNISFFKGLSPDERTN